MGSCILALLALQEAPAQPIAQPTPAPAPVPPGLVEPAARATVLSVIDGDTLKVVSLDGNGKESAKPATFGIRGVAAPALDQPFGKQALARLKEMVEGKTIIWNGPVLRAHKEGRSLHFRTVDVLAGQRG